MRSRCLLGLLGVGLLTLDGCKPAGPPPVLPATIAGDWEGALRVGPTQLRLVLHVTRAADGTTSATVDSLDQGSRGLPVTGITTEKDGWLFTLKKPSAAFFGKLSPTGDALVGEWRQGGLGLPLELKKSTGAAKRPAEIWEGTMKLPTGMGLRLVLHVERDPAGKLTASADSPDQGAKNLIVDTISLDGKTLAFSMKALSASYSGTLDANGTTATGDFTQRGAKMPLVLRKTDKVTEPRRPQNPKPPFPYRVEEVSYDNTAAKVKLAGTFTIPPGDGPHPAVLLITGSGPQDRDESLLGHKPFLVLADALTRRGIAVLRVDDRGVGGSTGELMNSTSEDLAGDALAGVAWLKARKEVDAHRIGLIGHSEGGLIAPMAAVRSDDVAYIVMIGGPGLPGAEILKLQGQLILKSLGADDKALARQAAIQSKILDIVHTEKDTKIARERIKAAMAESFAALTEEERKALGTSPEAFDAQAEQLLTPWFRFFLQYDPRPTLAKVRCPVLALIGEKDLQVPPKENIPALRAAFAKGGNARAEVMELPGVNHLLQTAKTGAPTEYAATEETIAPSALGRIADWILAVAVKVPAGSATR